ncbi:MAG: hypothetical protein VB064_07295 [Oscillospiraceae bacterium]|nr:hypothetical protein [Oscillospiraceae bacterium]
MAKKIVVCGERDNNMFGCGNMNGCLWVVVIIVVLACCCGGGWGGCGCERDRCC